MSDSIVSVEGLSHKYTRSWAIRDISFDVKKTGVVGLLGVNGAGKSTIMKIMCGVLKQTEGRVVIGGIDLDEEPEEAKKEIGFLPQKPPLYEELTIDEYLMFCAHLRKMDPSTVRREVDEAKERCGLMDFSDRLIKNLSGGYQQRTGIAQAIVHKPQLVVLDEPTKGLDPNQITEVRSLVKDIARDRAILFSTHILNEVQILCDEIRMIDQGELVFSDSKEAFNSYIAPNSLQVEMRRPPSEEELLKIEGVTDVKFLTERTLKIIFDEERDIANRIVKASVKGGWHLQEIYTEKDSLDEVFANLSSQTTTN